jgi:eukaryotic-like serine/threonine-protein kinase
MTPERYQRIDTIFQAALELDPERRSAFLEQACAGDSTLRYQVESLLTSDRVGLSFIDAAALDIGARLLASDEPELATGQRIDHYEVISLVGSGGMGEVYLAYDEKLNRNIALKLLPSDFTTNQERLRRFQQEARAASALNHPNIITIHEIGEVDKLHFIATEFVEGQTLRQRLKGESLDLHEALDVAIQICSALAAAHRAGIVHRDIKPENIMIRHDGYVKVLDFGLAKLTEKSERMTKIETADRVDVSSGLVMGTVRYMSPEQSQGLPVDQRSDIFSLGVVFYEMLTGLTPYGGQNPREIIKSILEAEPRPLADYLAHAHEELQRIVSKSLSKQTAERYQNAEEMLADLKRLGEKRTSVRTFVTAQIKEHKAIAGVGVATLLVGAVASAFAIYKLFRTTHIPFRNFNVTMLTNFDDAWWPSISPDGKYVAYVKGTSTTGSGKNSLWLKAIGSTDDVLLVPATEGYIAPTRFLPDGAHIAYSVQDPTFIIPIVQDSTFIIPISGGNPIKLPLNNAWVSFSPDGKRLAYLDNRFTEGKTALVVANSDGTGAHDITIRQSPNYYWTAMDPAWSPDGKVIVCVGQNGDESFPHLFGINIETKTETPITTQRWNGMGGLAWLPDMSGILVVASEETSSNRQIWEILYPGGEARRITNDTVNYGTNDIVNYGEIGLTKDGQALVTTRSEAPSSIWVSAVGQAVFTNRESVINADNAKQINVTNFVIGPPNLSWTPDGRIVYVSEESGNTDIWSMNDDGSNRKQLTADPHWDGGAEVSPDGRYIVFMSTRAGVENIWRMDIDGSNQIQLTSKHSGRDPVFSADGKWVYFVGREIGKATIWKIRVDGGQATEVVTNVSFSPLISPNGEMMLYVGPDGLIISRVDGGAPIKTLKELGLECRWSPDGRAITFLKFRDKVWNLWEQPLNGGTPRQLTNFTNPGVSKYAFSRDGKQLAVTRTTFTSDVILISESR